MTILAIETSCDETACAVVEGDAVNEPVRVLSNVVASSEEMHVSTGGIVPEVAAREQLRSIIPVIKESIKVAKCKSIKDIDAIAVTVGPGLVGSLLVGVETARALAYAWEKPIIPVNHLVAHLYANWVGGVPEFPAVGLVVSGGHTELVIAELSSAKSVKAAQHKSIKIQSLGTTRDDAAGECFDKCARLLGLPYPGGPAIARAAQEFSKIKLPRPLLHEDTYDFSFSGLKTALRLASLAQGKPTELAYELQEAIVDVLVSRVMRAVEEFRPKSVLLGGGVAANFRLRESLNEKLKMQPIRRIRQAHRKQAQGKNAKLFIPPVELCTDNAVMIGAAAYYNYSPLPWQEIRVDPGLEISGG